MKNVVMTLVSLCLLGISQIRAQCTSDTIFSDVVFLIDNSGSIDDTEFAAFSEIIRASANRIQTDCPYAQIAVMHYGGNFGRETAIEYPLSDANVIDSIDRQFCTERNPLSPTVCLNGGGDDLNYAVGQVDSFLMNGTLMHDMANNFNLVIFTDAFDGADDCTLPNCSVLKPFTNIDLLKSRFDAQVTVVGASAQANPALLQIYASPGGTYVDAPLDPACASTIDGCVQPRKYLPIEFNSPVNQVAQDVQACVSCQFQIVTGVMVDAGPDRSICNDISQSVTLNAIGSIGTQPYSYVWSTGSTSSSIQVSPASTTTYFVTITDASNCTFTDSVTVMARPCCDNFDVTAGLSQDSICRHSSQAVQLSATAGGNMSMSISYTWNQGLGTDTSYMVSPSATTTYIVTAIDNNSCQASDTITLYSKDCQDCFADAGTPNEYVELCLISGVANLPSDRNIGTFIPPGYEEVFILSDRETTKILDYSIGRRTFTVRQPGLYRLHTLIAEVTDRNSPNYIDLNTLINIGDSEIIVIANCITEHGVCAAFDYPGRVFNVLGPDDMPCMTFENSINLCGDGRDNDGDGLVDCADPDCADLVPCQENTIIACNDLTDNDGDGLVDCFDPDCYAFTLCFERGAQCNDGIDNDGDGLVDCADSSCDGSAPCTEDTPFTCADGRDNDNDGLTDCQDPKCKDFIVCAEYSIEACRDGIDNDFNGLVDCKDHACRELLVDECDPSENNYTRCSDGIDNDGDGLVDCADPDCHYESLWALENMISDVIEVTEPTCPDNDNGMIQFVGAALDDDYQFSIDGGQSFVANTMFAGLDVGTYGIAIRSELGCVIYADVELRGDACIEICNNNIDDDADGLVDCADGDCQGQSDPYTPSIGNIRGASCPLFVDGGIRISGVPVGVQFSVDGGRYQTLQQFSRLGDGEHTLSYRDQMGCYGSITFTIPRVGDQDGDDVCDGVDVCPDFDDMLIGTPCDDGDRCTGEDIYTSACECRGTFMDADSDGVCDAEDVCPSGDDTTIGQPCDDGNICTVNDIITTACHCEGVMADRDGDGICDAEDNCPDVADNRIGTACDDGDPCTVNDTYTTDCNCIGTIADADGDGTCDIWDRCPGTDDRLIGTACDDGDPCTTNDRYNDACNCQGTWTDSDADGICDADDTCPDTNDSIIGTVCDDGDPCTTNDVYDTACNCVGQRQDADGDGTCDALDQCPGFDNRIFGRSCDDGDPCTVDDSWQTDCQCRGTVVDSDGDGICDAEDTCPTTHNNIIGTRCDDGNSCTINDVYNDSCQCAGTFADSDADGVCDADDVCPSMDDTLIGTACDDGDDCTINDVYTTNCGCQGTVQDSDNDGVCDAEDLCPLDNDNLIGSACDDGDPCTINDVFTAECQCMGENLDTDGDGICDEDEICPDLDDALIGTACDDGDDCTVNDVYTTDCACLGTPQDSDNDGVCDANDVCEGLDDALIGTPCDDGTACTINDVYTSACICQGTYMDSDGDSICDAEDVCPDFDNSLIGTACDDDDACTVNDVYNDSCQCAGTFADSDADGVCDADDACEGFDDRLVGTACDDGTACTINDVYTSACICQGTYMDSDGDSICDAEDECPDFDNSLIGTACDDGDACTVNDVYNDSCQCAGTFADSDADGVCDADDACEGFDDRLVGTACDDGTACTINDVYTSACICQGTYMDSDGDSICDAEDVCPDFDNSLIGTACDDGDDCTTGDAYTDQCNCQGTLIDSNQNDICDNDEPCVGAPCVEICDNNIDDDGDGLTDCADPDCSPIETLFDITHPTCDESGIIAVTNPQAGYSYVSDGVTDTIFSVLADTVDIIVTNSTGCTDTYTFVLETSCAIDHDSSEICDNNIDDDGDGLVDCVDGDCCGRGNCSSAHLELAYTPIACGLETTSILISDYDESLRYFTEPILERVDDRFVNVEDGTYMIYAVSLCDTIVRDDVVITYEYCIELCDNGVDDDRDGLVDCDDDDCTVVTRSLVTDKLSHEDTGLYANAITSGSGIGFSLMTESLVSTRWTRDDSSYTESDILLDFDIDSALDSVDMELVLAEITLYADPNFNDFDGGQYGANAANVYLLDQSIASIVGDPLEPYLYNESAMSTITQNNDYDQIKVDVTELINKVKDESLVFDGFVIRPIDDIGNNSLVFASGGHRDQTITPELTLYFREESCAAAGEITAQQNVKIDLKVKLEGASTVGAYDMNTDLNDGGYLPGQRPKTFFGRAAPMGQPYSVAPWFYEGSEGVVDVSQGQSVEDLYSADVVDWILISLRSTAHKLSEVWRGAGLLHSDGTITMFEEPFLDIEEEYYVVIEHRNHLPIMTPFKMSIDDASITYDFTQADSYKSIIGVGQTIDEEGNYMMIAGNGDLILDISSDIDVNIRDLSKWFEKNGANSSYFLEDYDMNGDINIRDRILWERNNGLFTTLQTK